MVRLVSSGAVSVLAALAAGAPIEKADAEYDYVIVGGGLTGLVAAARLSENADGKMTPTLRHVIIPHASTETF